MIGVRAPGRQDEPGGPGGLRHPRQSAEVARVLQPIQIKVETLGAERQGRGAGAGEPGHGEHAARSVRIREIVEELRGDLQRGGGEYFGEPHPFGRGEKARRRQDRLELQAGSERLGDQVGTLEQGVLRAFAFTSPETPNILEPLILTAGDHDDGS